MSVHFRQNQFRYVITKRGDQKPHGCTQLRFQSTREALQSLLVFKRSAQNMIYLWGLLSPDQKRTFPSHLKDRDQILKRLAPFFVSGRFSLWMSQSLLLSLPKTAPLKQKGKRPATKTKEDTEEKEKIIRFQICGGEFTDGIGIAKAPYRVVRPGHPETAGTTDQDGDVKIKIKPGETVRIHIFDTIYVVNLEASRKLVDLAQPRDITKTSRNLRDFQKRLDILGYLTGHLQSRASSQQFDSGSDNPETQQAIMQFGVDHGFPPDGEIPTGFLTKLLQVTKNAKGTRAT